MPYEKQPRPICQRLLDPRGAGLHMKKHQRNGDRPGRYTAPQPRQVRPYTRRAINATIALQPAPEPAVSAIDRINRLKQETNIAVNDLVNERIRLEGELASINRILNENNVPPTPNGTFLLTNP